MDEPVKTDMSGHKKSEPTVKNAMMTKRRRQRCRPKGFVAKEALGTARLLSKAGLHGSDCLVTEMLQCLPMETVHIGSKNDSKENARLQRRGQFFALCSCTVFLKKPDANLEKGLRGFLSIALLSVFSNWYTTVLVDLLHEEKELTEWRSLHVGAERGVSCEYML